MPNVFIHRPGTHNSATIIDPDTGLDKEVVEWSFNATVDGRVGIVSAYFPPGTSEDGAAKRLRQQLIDDPKSLEGITSTGGGGEGSNGEGGSGTGVVVVVVVAAVAKEVAAKTAAMEKAAAAALAAAAKVAMAKAVARVAAVRGRRWWR